MRGSRRRTIDAQTENLAPGSAVVERLQKYHLGRESGGEAEVVVVREQGRYMGGRG